MKRAELHVGDELFYATPYNWRQFRGTKAVVVAVEPYKANTFARNPFLDTTSGPGVLVDLDYHAGPRRDVVSLAHLRGPYATVEAQMEAARERRVAEYRDAADQRAARQDAADAVVERAAAAGVRARTTQGGDLVELTPAALAALLDRAGIR